MNRGDSQPVRTGHPEPVRTGDAERHLRDVLPAWGKATEIGARLSGGVRNEVWDVRVGGRRCAVRLSTRSVAALDWELALLLDLNRAGVSVSVPVPTPDGRLQVESVTVFAWMDGRMPRSQEDWRLVEATITTVHLLTRDRPQRPGFRSARDLLWEDTGGYVHLDAMPTEVVAQIRAAWQPLADESHCVVHGDPNGENVRIAEGRAGLLDWDEARVDAPLFDLAALPLEHVNGVAPDALGMGRRASVAWEVANGWTTEPEYARSRLRELQAMVR